MRLLRKVKRVYRTFKIIYKRYRTFNNAFINRELNQID